MEKNETDNKGENIDLPAKPLVHSKLRKIVHIAMNAIKNEFGVATNFGFKSYDATTFKLKEDFEREDFFLKGGVKIAVPYFNTNIFALVPLVDQGPYHQNTVFKFSVEENKYTDTFSINSKITKVHFTKQLILLCGYDEIHILKVGDFEIYNFLKTSANIGRYFNLCYTPSNTSFAFRSMNLDQLLIHNIKTNKEVGFFPFNEGQEIQFIKFNSGGKMLASVSSDGKYIAVHDTISFNRLKLFFRGHNSTEIIAIEFSPNDNYMATITHKGTLHIFSFGSEIERNEPITNTIVKSQLGVYFDYFQSENHFAVAHTPFNTGSLLEKYLGFPIISFVSKVHETKRKKRVIYENELKVIWPDGVMSRYSFDNKNGGACEKIYDDLQWINTKEIIPSFEIDSDDDWVLLS